MDINVLILSKSGAGKSTLLNYLWGDKIAETDIGRPVTPKEKDGSVGLFKHPPVKLNGYNLIVSDSWGLEQDKATEWLRVVMPQLEKHESSPNVEDWFHAVIYCIGASGARIEPFETKEIIYRLQKAGHSVVIALTKANRASKDELTKLRQTINDDCPSNVGIVEIESLNVELRNGSITRSHGKDELIISLTSNLSEKLKRKFASQYLNKCRKICQEWKVKVLRKYDDEAGLFTSTSTALKTVGKYSELELQYALQALEDWRKNEVEKLENFQMAFGEVVSESYANNKLEIRSLISRAKIEWAAGDYVAWTLMSIFPLINLIYIFVGTEMHKDLLTEKLDKIISEVVDKVGSHIPADWKQ